MITTLAPEMLRQYRQTTTPQFREHVDALNSMSLADRDELLFYMVSYMASQYAAMLQMMMRLGPQDGGLGSGSPQGRAN